MTKLSEIKEGDVLVVGHGFNCLEPATEHEVEMYAGGLFVACKYGKHFLEGQCDNNGNLVGFTKLQPELENAN